MLLKLMLFFRMIFKMCTTILILLASLYATVTIATNVDLTKEPGHLKAFGEVGVTHSVREVDGFLNPAEFFGDHVSKLKPVKFKGAAKLSPAFEKWSDDYFLSQDDRNEFVHVEKMKKEDRNGQGTTIAFKHFIKTYNDSDVYMVNSVPKAYE